MAGPAPVAPAPDLDAIRGRLGTVRQAMAAAAAGAGRPGDAVELLAVTKGHGADVARAALAVGLSRLGENYVQECEAKDRLLAAPGESGPAWHLIGHLQRNKARRAASLFAEVETVDSVEVARRLGAARTPGPPLSVCCEVELTGLDGRTGFRPEVLRTALAELAAIPGIAIRGLMTVAAPGDPRAFAACRRLRDDLVQAHGVPLPVLSMGMSDDYAAAIAAGSTRVRLGRALFGDRPR